MACEPLNQNAMIRGKIKQKLNIYAVGEGIKMDAKANLNI